jgi:hypothetical protein
MKTLVGKKIFFLSTIFFVAAIFAYGFIFFEVKYKISSVSNSEAGLIEKEKLVDESRLIKNFFRDTEIERNLVLSYAVSEDSAVAFIDFIESLGKKSGVRVVIDNVSEKVESSGTKNLELKISALGEWGNVFRFSQAIENIPYKSVISNIYFSLSNPNTNSDPKIKTDPEWTAHIIFNVLKF